MKRVSNCASLSTGNFDGALDTVENLEKILPGLAMVALRKINLLRRMRNFKDVKKEYAGYIEAAKDTSLKSFYSIRYARFLSKIMDDYTGAKQVLQDALDADSVSGIFCLLVCLIITQSLKYSIFSQNVVELPLIDSIAKSLCHFSHFCRKSYFFDENKY